MGFAFLGLSALAEALDTLDSVGSGGSIDEFSFFLALSALPSALPRAFDSVAVASVILLLDRLLGRGSSVVIGTFRSSSASSSFSALRFFLGGSPDTTVTVELEASPDALAFSTCFRFLVAICLCFSRLAFKAASLSFCVA